MNIIFSDTIVARATPVGRGGVGIIRISGPHTPAVAKEILGKVLEPRYATFCDFQDLDGTLIDQGLAIFFKAPHSFTGEDVLELHGHGGPVVMEMLLRRVLDLGARMARPGEFSQRAYLNNKLDLTQAEAIADLIAASSQQAARSAVESLRGTFSNEVRSLVKEVVNLRVYVEAAIDFPDEEVDFLSDGTILRRLSTLLEQVSLILQRAMQGRALKEGMKVVITGHPNVGKSSLLNLMSGEDTAIVSALPGTTRDLIKETILLDGMPLNIIDTAGLRDAVDSIESEGIRRAWSEITNADQILLIIDASACSVKEVAQHNLLQQLDSVQDRLTIIRNKIDLIDEPEGVTQHPTLGVTVINISVKHNQGVDLLKAHLKQVAGYQSGENVLLARQRHLDALNRTLQSLTRAIEQLTVYQAGELVAQELLEAQNALNEITGEFRSDDLLGEIFSSFCIGK